MDLLQRQLADLAAQTDTITDSRSNLTGLEAQQPRLSYTRSKIIFVLGNSTSDAAKWAYLELPTPQGKPFPDTFLTQREIAMPNELQTIRQTSSIMAYTQKFNLQVHQSGWDDTVLISLYNNERRTFKLVYHPTHK
ncbi:hypothetical protein VP01_6630g1 [Puccinia sorghi]|uniref:Uncharacterized protein n=1 Tax=Puccinia sorghi TaxID=27349 RepID=A0A0L6UF63_9BASI|nr:hypothetical protein VP01_6630g1 [Puccinia sorghi]